MTENVKESLTNKRAGFTGTRNGTSVAQFTTLAALVRKLSPSEWHHGDCIGSDEQSHRIAVRKQVPVYIHPPTNTKAQAWSKGAAVVYPAKAYIKRNHDIVNSTDLLIACPEGEETVRSGTWATVRYARKLKRPIFIIWPKSGSITTENV